MAIIICLVVDNRELFYKWATKIEEKRAAKAAFILEENQYIDFDIIDLETPERTTLIFMRLNYNLPNILPQVFFKKMIERSLKAEGIKALFIKDKKAIEQLILMANVKRIFEESDKFNTAEEYEASLPTGEGLI